MGGGPRWQLCEQRNSHSSSSSCANLHTSGHGGQNFRTRRRRAQHANDEGKSGNRKRGSLRGCWRIRSCLVKLVVAGIEDSPLVAVVDVEEEDEVCGNLRLDSLHGDDEEGEAERFCYPAELGDERRGGATTSSSRGHGVEVLGRRTRCRPPSLIPIGPPPAQERER